MSGQLIVMTTVEGPEVAEKLARDLVERRLAACVNVLGPVRSIYRWKGQVELAEERILIIKTVHDHLERAREAIREGAGYELPEFITLDISGGDETYLNWLTAQCTASPTDSE